MTNQKLMNQFLQKHLLFTRQKIPKVFLQVHKLLYFSPQTTINQL